MLDFERALDNNRVSKALLGVSPQEFERLLPAFADALNSSTERTQEGKPRQRAVGGGRTHSLKGVRSKLIFILLYLKVYPTFDLAGFIFCVHRSRCCRWVQDYLPILEIALGEKCCLPARKTEDLAAFFERFPDTKNVWVDGTERRVQRPKDDDEQRTYYSGKKKAHTGKHLITNDHRKYILHLSELAPGSKHDYQMFKESELGEALDIPIAVDLGFQGICKDYPQLDVLIPFKKPKGGKLSDEEKEINQQIASTRVLSEHAIGGVKRLRVLSDVFRNRVDGMLDKVMYLGCGLWNLHVLGS